MATPPNSNSPLNLLNAYGRRVWQMSSAAQKRQRLVTHWHCNICTYENDIKLSNCQMCTQSRNDNNNIASNVRMINPYFEGGGVLNVPPPISQQYTPYNSVPYNSNSHSSVNQESEYKQPASQPVPLNAISDNVKDTLSNLHPALLQKLNGSVDDFKRAVVSIGASSNKEKWSADTILGANDWLHIPTTELLDNFGKPFSAKDVDRLYVALQTYIKNKPDGPWRGETFWSAIKKLTNSTRKWTSWKTQFNNYTKDDKKGKHRWSQLNAIKALIRTKRSKHSVNSQLSSLQNWTETEKKKRDAAQARKDKIVKEAQEHKQKLGLLLDYAIQEQQQKKLKSVTAAQNPPIDYVQNTANLPPLIPPPMPVKKNQFFFQKSPPISEQISHQLNLPTLSNQQLIKHPIIASEPTAVCFSTNQLNPAKGRGVAAAESDANNKILTEIKDMIDDIEDDGLIDAAQLIGLKQMLYLNDNLGAMSTVIEEYSRLDGKYYGDPEKIIKKLVIIFNLFHK